MRTQKKILYIITKSNFGGAQKYVFELAAAAKDSGHEVAVACGGTGTKNAELGLLASKLVEAGVRVIPIKHFMRDVSIGKDLAAFTSIWRLLREEKPDILHVTSSKAGGIGAMAGRLTKVPRIIFTSHGLTIDETWRPFWQRCAIYLGTWFTMKNAHSSIMISTETYERARRMPGMKSKVSLIKNGIAPVDFKTREEARTELELYIPDGHFLIGGIGELHQNKNWLAAIHAITNLPHHLYLAIIGSGEEYESLKQHAEQFGVSNRVHLLGYVPDADSYLRAFDIFLLPSKKEGLPYVLLEAGLAGLPVVASDLPGNHDIIESGVTGFLIEPTPRIIATSVEMLMRDEGMRRRFGSALQEKVMEAFSIHKMVESTFELYDSKMPLIW
jgi:glycosyltransferase involved in cell wall biosynthesis